MSFTVEVNGRKIRCETAEEAVRLAYMPAPEAESQTARSRTSPAQPRMKKPERDTAFTALIGRLCNKSGLTDAGILVRALLEADGYTLTTEQLVAEIDKTAVWVGRRAAGLTRSVQSLGIPHVFTSYKNRGGPSSSTYGLDAEFAAYYERLLAAANTNQEYTDQEFPNQGTF